MSRSPEKVTGPGLLAGQWHIGCRLLWREALPTIHPIIHSRAGLASGPRWLAGLYLVASDPAVNPSLRIDVVPPPPGRQCVR